MILFYTEGGHYLGLGNIFRSLSLAKELRKKQPVEIAFLTSSEQYARDIIAKAGFPVIGVESKDEVLPKAIEVRPDVLVIDYLNISEEFVKAVKENGTKVAIVGNDNDANHHADIVVNAIIGTGFKNRSFTDEYGTLNLWGPKYLVLRDEFESIRGSYRYTGKLKNVVLLFGGSDQADFTSQVLSKLLCSAEDFAITAVVGAGYRNDEALQRVIDEHGDKDNFRILRNISNVGEIYATADFLFSSPGTALFEGMCIGIPAISYFQNESQVEVFGPFFTTAHFDATTDVVADMKRVYSDIEAYNSGLESLSVGKGRNEIIDSILNLTI